MAADSEPRSLLRSFLRQAGPNILANVAVPLAGLIDAAMLGHLDALHHLAGVALATIVFDYLLWTFGFLRMGTTGLAAQAIGRGEPGEALCVAVRAALLGVCVGALLLALREPIAAIAFDLLEGTPDVKAAALDYYRARLWGAPVTLVNYALLGWLLGRQRSELVLALSVVGAGVNVGLDYLLIYRLGLASAGAGYATALSQACVLIVGLALVSPALARLRGQLSWRRIVDSAGVRALLGLGRDLAVRTFALLTAFAVFTDFSAALGTATLASNTLLLRVFGLAAFVIDGHAFACEALAGLMRGRGDQAGLRAVLRIGLYAGVGTGLAFAAALLAFPGVVFGLLTDHVELVEQTAASAPWLAPVLAVGAAAFILDGYFIGLAAGRTLSRAMLAALALGFAPLALWARFVAPPALASDGLWAAMTCFMLARVVTLGLGVPATLRGPSPRAR
ncbi:MAG: MATE family efflux transporter [Nannocystaceae bacterium]|nr:MATE family efflux transporter [Myxococcales bacterium]